MATVDVIANRSSATAVLGKAYFETDTNSFIVYNGSGWVELESDGTGGVFVNQASLQLDGSNDHMAVTGITLPTAKTVSFWVRWQGGGNAVLFGDNRGNYYPYMDNTRDLKLSNRHQITAWDLGAGNGLTNTWSHIAIAGDGTTAKLYKDGVYIGSAADRAPGAMDKIGGASLSGSRYLNGGMDEFAIFSSALSDGGGLNVGDAAQGDIATLYNNGVPGDLSALTPLHWWHMGDGDSGSTITDHGVAANGDPSGNNGTLKNGASVYSATLDPNPDGAGPDFSSNVPTS